MNKKKKLGRPKAKALLVPAWAIKRIEELAKSSGVSPERTLESALKMGLYAVAEQYAGLIQFQASADELFFGTPEEPTSEPLPVARDPEETEEPLVTYEPTVKCAADPIGETEPEPIPEDPDPAENGSFATALQ